MRMPDFTRSLEFELAYLQKLPDILPFARHMRKARIIFGVKALRNLNIILENASLETR